MKKAVKRKSGAPSALKRALAERDGALKYQAATQEILASIRSSVTDAQPVFDAIVKNVLGLFGTRYAAVFLIRDGQLHLVGVSVVREMREARKQFRESFPQPIDYGTFTGKALRSGKVSQLVPVIGNPQSTPQAEALARTFSYDCLVVAPLVREDQVIGAIGTAHPKAKRFEDKELALLKSFADHAVIAIENVRLFNETREALEQQTATADILRVISSSPTDVQPVLEAIVRSATKLVPGCSPGIVMLEGRTLHHRAIAGPDMGPEARATIAKFFPTELDPEGSPLSRSIAERTVVEIPDCEAAGLPPKYALAGRAMNYRSLTFVPLVREGAGIGAVAISHPRPGFKLTEKQLVLLKTFAAQAVIAIENVRLFNETREALDQQKASAEVLGAISGSIADTKPVFEKILASCERLFEGELVGITLADGDTVRLAAYHGPQGEQLKNVYPLPLTRESGTGWAILNAQIAHFPDIEAAGVPPGVVAGCRTLKVRAIVFAPMLFEGKGIGAIWVARAQPGAFTDKQIAQLRTFADQAVIAIQNARLFNETQEALERQTATAEILKVIAGSPADVQPVFDAILRSAVTLCGAELAAVFPFDGELVHLGATHNWPPAALQYFSKVYPSPPSPHLLSGRTILSKSIVQIADAAADEHYDPDSAATGHWRRMLGAPMLREGKPLGALVVAWRDPGEAPQRQVELLQTFADQAAIAIENVRLFNETKEALERQTATADILKVISSSPTDVQPVFDTIAENALRLCDATSSLVSRFDGSLIHVAAMRNINPQGAEAIRSSFPATPSGRGATSRAIHTGTVVHIADVMADPGYTPGGIAERAGIRTLLAVPMLRGGNAVGAIGVSRPEPRPFSDHDIALLKSFADQAVIAIENVRLFNETKEALEQQRASGEVLAVISSSIADVKPVFDKILESCQRLFAGKIVGVTVVGDDGRIHLGPYEGRGREQFEKVFPLPLDRSSGSGLAILEMRVLHYPDIEADGVPEAARRGARATGTKAVLFAPMLWQGKAVGVIFVGREQAGAFTEKEIALLKTFADQAVIAIQNARLFREIQEKSAQLEVANKHKSDFLANMSHELRTPLNAIIGFSEVLSERMFGEVNEKQAEYLKDIHESGRHLLSLINDILDLSKIEAGRMELELSSFDLPSAVSNAMTLVRERAQRHGIQLGLEMDPGLGELQADERKVKQILLNLLSNAVKFTPDGGRVDVLARKMDGKVQIAVRDNGIGIAPEDHDAVFEEFKQVGRDYTRKAEGTGLGLALTRRLVELHGGEIALESALGKGSTFTVRLPLR